MQHLLGDLGSRRSRPVRRIVLLLNALGGTALSSIPAIATGNGPEETDAIDQAAGEPSTAKDAPFFIVGSGRSGTTLLRLILSAHPRLHIPPETWFLRALVRELPLTGTLTPEQVARAVAIMTAQSRWPDMQMDAAELAERARALPAPRLVDVINLVYRRQLEIHGKPRFGDKTPQYIHIIPQLCVLYPGAKFIHMIRDGHDVAMSLWDVGWARYYDRDFEWTAAIREKEAYAKTSYRSRILDVKYEDLVAEPEAVMRRICAFLGEEYQPGMLDGRHRTELVPEREHRYHLKLAQPLSPDAIGRWRRELSGWECFAIEACLQRELRAVGYRLRFSSPAWRPLMGIVRWSLWALTPLLTYAIPFLQRRHYLTKSIYLGWPWRT